MHKSIDVNVEFKIKHSFEILICKIVTTETFFVLFNPT